MDQSVYCIRHSFGDVMCTADMSQCKEPGCNNETTSGSFRCCHQCSHRLNKCQLCGESAVYIKANALVAVDEKITAMEKYLTFGLASNQAIEADIARLKELRGMVETDKVSSIAGLMS